MRCMKNDAARALLLIMDSRGFCAQLNTIIRLVGAQAKAFRRVKLCGLRFVQLTLAQKQWKTKNREPKAERTRKRTKSRQARQMRSARCCRRRCVRHCDSAGECGKQKRTPIRQRHLGEHKHRNRHRHRQKATRTNAHAEDDNADDDVVFGEITGFYPSGTVAGNWLIFFPVQSVFGVV